MDIFNYDNQFSTPENDHNLWEDRFYLSSIDYDNYYEEDEEY